MTEYKTELFIKQYKNISNITNAYRKYNLSNLTNLSMNIICYSEPNIYCLFDFLRESNITYFEILDTNSANQFISIILENKYNIIQPSLYKFFNNLKTLKLSINEYHLKKNVNTNDNNIIKFLRLCPNIKQLYLKRINNLVINNIKVNSLSYNYRIHNNYIRGGLNFNSYSYNSTPLLINNYIRKIKIYGDPLFSPDPLLEIDNNYFIKLFPNLFSIVFDKELLGSKKINFKYTKKIYVNEFRVKYFLPGKYDQMSLKNICLNFIYNDTSINVKNKKFHIHKDLRIYGKYNFLDRPMISHKNYYKHDFLNQSIASNRFSNLPYHIKEQLLINSNYIVQDFTKTITVYY